MMHLQRNCARSLSHSCETNISLWPVSQSTTTRKTMKKVFCTFNELLFMFFHRCRHRHQRQRCTISIVITQLHFTLGICETLPAKTSVWFSWPKRKLWNMWCRSTLDTMRTTTEDKIGKTVLSQLFCILLMCSRLVFNAKGHHMSDKSIKSAT